MKLMKVLYFKTEYGTAPFTEWLTKLKDRKGRATILARINRLKLGNFGDCKPVGDGVYELRIDFGAGYRVYYAKSGNEIVLILCGGIKKTQQSDIDKAKEYWSKHN
jgi:putative addiction module killer protein